MLQQFKFLASQPQFRDAPVRTAMRLGAWRVHCLLSRGATIDLVSTPLRMTLPPQALRQYVQSASVSLPVSYHATEPATDFEVVIRRKANSDHIEISRR